MGAAIPQITSRRFFLKAAATTAAALAASRIAPARALGANDRISFGVVGCGEQGAAHVTGLVERVEADNVSVRAVADICRRRVTHAQGICQGDGYLDYRNLIERRDIDAVLVATPDHWHAKIAVDALESGKHVYVETPMTHTIGEALALRDAVRRTKRVLQVGSQVTATECFWQAHEAIRDGRIGKATWAQARVNCSAGGRLSNDDLKSDPAAGLLYQHLAPLLIAMSGPNGEYPSRVNASGGLYITKDGRGASDTFLMTADYPGEYSIFLIGTPANEPNLPERIYGKYGVMDLNMGMKISPNGQISEVRSVDCSATQTRIPPKPARDIAGNFIDTIRGRANTLYCNVELGTAAMVAIRMAVESCRQNKTMVWDAEKEQVLGGRPVEV
ncbi:MAG: Gfo/Idh/MocA family oxidoreductase [Acidobacteria bacterium]|nr:Gfo/Idh/MocA family oxidoreductase [Acidobacteriota bacterium]